MTQAARAAELAARASYGKLLAILSARSRDISLAEDCLADAFAEALANWPRHGVPTTPDAWLLSVARNRMTDRHRRMMRFPETDEILDMMEADPVQLELPDRRLSLMMVCAHPAIATEIHTPLMLQTVLGIQAADIARIFMIPPSSMAQRLVRAKRKIKQARIPFDLPDQAKLAERASAMFEAIYAVHALDWLDPADGLGEEALYLADLLARLMAQNAEARGLAALIALSHARRTARFVDGLFVPLDEQETGLWDREVMAYGLRQLNAAKGLDQIGRFQLEAAIQAAHMVREAGRDPDWDALNKLYFVLIKLAPSLGAQVAQAVVTSHLHGSAAGLQALDRIEAQSKVAFQPLWAARADLLVRTRRPDQADTAYEKAISLTTDAPLRRFLQEKQRKLRNGM